MTRRLNVTPKITEQHLIVRSGKSEAVTIIKDCARGITLLKLTTDRHKASRGLSATAELLNVVVYYIGPGNDKRCFSQFQQNGFCCSWVRFVQSA